MEIPNIIKLQKDIGEEKLVIIGLASDKEENVKDFISKNGLKYKNAIASKEILDNYFVVKFPTTLLIDPDGKILAIDLRGEKLTEIVKAKWKSIMRNTNLEPE